MKKIAVAFTGPSNSGKTTLILNISEFLKERGYKVCIIKHDPQDKAVFDTVGKDSWKFTQSGADVVVVSPNKTTFLKQSTSSIEEIAMMFGDFDYLLVEGLKTLPLPRIAIFRNSLDEKYFDVTDAIAVDETIQRESIPKTSYYLDLNNTKSIVDWIDANGCKL